MINRVILVGRITKDPELRFIQGDIPLVNFTLAVNRNFTNKSGVKEVDFIRCSLWNKQAENLAKYVLKGALLGVEGSIRVTSSENNNQKQFFTEVKCDSVQFLSNKNNSSNNNNDYYSNQDHNNMNVDENHTQNQKLIIDNEEELPF
ncbi:MAG: single-stranded DNA-binding protein [Columbia Basin potato purple top phytoplasma]